MAPFMIKLEGTHFLYSNKYSKRHHFELGENPNLRNVGKIISCQLQFMLYKKKHVQKPIFLLLDVGAQPAASIPFKSVYISRNK